MGGLLPAYHSPFTIFVVTSTHDMFMYGHADSPDELYFHKGRKESMNTATVTMTKRSADHDQLFATYIAIHNTSTVRIFELI